MAALFYIMQKAKTNVMAKRKKINETLSLACHQCHNSGIFHIRSSRIFRKEVAC